MLANLLTNQTTAPTPLRRPEFTISLGGGDGGGLGGLSSTVTSLVGGSDSDPWQDYTRNIKIECGCAPFVDQATIQLAPGAQSPAAALSDEGSIELGYSDSGTRSQFSGSVIRLKELAQGTRQITLANASQTLAQLRVNMTFQEMSPSDIVQQMISMGDVSAGNMSPGNLILPVYIVDDRRSVYQHIARLASWSGHISYIDADNQLNWLALSTAQPVQTFVYGDDLLAIEQLQQSGCQSNTRWQGEGSAGSNGSGAWNWLSKTADANASGADPGESRINFQGAFRNPETVEQAATGFKALPQCQPTRLRLLSSGTANVSIGTTIAISGTPEGKLDSECVVIQIKHLLNKTQGFTTELEAVTLNNNDGADSLLGGLL